MIDSLNESRPVQAGDVFAFAVERIGRYAACQVVAVDAVEKKATVAVLGWSGESLPDIADLADVPRLARTFFFWQPAEVLDIVCLPPPAGYRRIGTLPVSGNTQSRSCGGWSFADVVASQYRWDSLPTGLTRAFKDSLSSDQRIKVPGLFQPDGDELHEFRVGGHEARTFSDDARYRIGPDFALSSLVAWPALTKVVLHRWRDDLVAFLGNAPLVYELELSGHGQRELDLSRSSLSRLSLDTTGLERLLLPPTLDVLVLHGDAAGELSIDAEGAGRWITLHVSGSVRPIRGLEKLRGLCIRKIARMSVREVVARHPGITCMNLFGAPGYVDDLPELACLPALSSLWLGDLFGFGPGDFPRPADVPQLTSIDLDSVPVEAAKDVKSRYRAAAGVELSIRRARKPEWLAENLENPLRAWDGREGFSQTTVKKASAAYRTALKATRAASAQFTPMSAELDAAGIAAIGAFLSEIAALNRKCYFLDTLEREEVIGAVDILSAGLSPQAQSALEPVIEEALD